MKSSNPSLLVSPEYSYDGRRLDGRPSSGGDSSSWTATPSASKHLPVHAAVQSSHRSPVDNRHSARGSGCGVSVSASKTGVVSAHASSAAAVLARTEAPQQPVVHAAAPVPPEAVPNQTKKPLKSRACDPVMPQESNLISAVQAVRLILKL